VGRCPHTPRISAWLDGELARTRSEALERHVPDCPMCQEERDSFKQISAMFDPIRRMAVPENSEEELLVPKLSPWIRPTLSVAALVLLWVGALLGLSSRLSEEGLQFEGYLEAALDSDVYEVTRMVEKDLSRDQVVGMVISNSH